MKQQRSRTIAYAHAASSNAYHYHLHVSPLLRIGIVIHEMQLSVRVV